MTRIAAGAALAALLVAVAAGQDKAAKPADKKPGNPFADLPKLDTTANDLACVAKLRAARAAAGERERAMLAQMLAAEAALAGVRRAGGGRDREGCPHGTATVQ